MREKLITLAQNEYGITSADQMSNDQLTDEMLAIDKQHPDYKAPKPPAKKAKKSK